MTSRRVGWPEANELASLVREAQRGVPDALDVLLSRLRPPLYAFFSNRLGPDVAEDLAQNALIRIAGALHRIDPDRGDAYVSTVARNLLRTEYRRRVTNRRRCADVDPGAIPEWRESPDVRGEHDELLRAVHRVSVAQLDAPLSEIVLALLRGETAAEIAKRKSISPVTIRTRLLRARAILRRELRAHLEPANLPKHDTRAHEGAPI